MSVEVITPTIMWKQRLDHSITSKAPATMNNKTILGKRVELESNTIYEYSDIKNLRRVHRTESIIQQTLLTDSVLFQIMRKDFEDIVEVYRAIKHQIHEVDGLALVSKSSTNNRSNFLLAVNFVDKEDCFKTIEDCFKTIEDGFKLNDNTYFASPTTSADNDNTAKLIWIRLSLVQAKRSELSIGIKESLRHYDKVCMVKEFLKKSFFEGQVSVLLDINHESEKDTYVPLQKMLYLPYWDRYVPTSLKGRLQYVIFVNKRDI